MPLASQIELPERYRVARHIASGGMASVWEAEDLMLGRVVAVKVLAEQYADDPAARERFQREARTAAQVSDQTHVVTIYDIGEHGRDAFIVMEYFAGGTVADRLRAARKAGEPIPRETALRWLGEAAAGLDVAHAAGIVHRDVKPANLLLDTKGRLAIGDFGIARLGLEDQITQTGQVLGTAAYLSPEQAMGEPATAASDRYALAVVAFELLTGSKPFEAEHFAAQARAHVEDDPPLASARDIDVPPAIDPVLERGMAKAPGERWESAGAMVRALDDALAAPPPRRARARAADATRVMGAPPPRRGANGAMAVPPRAPRRGWGAGALVALAALLLVVAGAVALVTANGDDPEGGGTAQRDPQPTATRDATRTPEATATATATAEEPAATATATPTEEAPESAAPPEKSKQEKKDKGGVPGNDPAALQLQAFELNNAGDHEQALAVARKAVRLCAGSTAVAPCAYALFEYAKALRLTGDPAGAIAVLEERKQRFPDNQPAAVEKELALAREAAAQGN